MSTPASEPSIALGEDYSEIREAIRAICAEFPGEYWRELDARDGYPEEFVNVLAAQGYLAVLIPEEFGGSGLTMRAAGVILEEFTRAAARRGLPRADVHDGTLLSPRQPGAEGGIPARIASGELRLQAFGVTEPTSGTDTTRLQTRAVRDGDRYLLSGQKVCISRALHSDLMLLLARTTPIDEVEKKTQGLSVFLVDIHEARGNGMVIQPLKAMINHSTTEVFMDNVPIRPTAWSARRATGSGRSWTA